MGEGSALLLSQARWMLHERMSVAYSHVLTSLYAHRP